MFIIITYFFKYFNSAIEGVEETKQQKGKKGAQSATGDKQGNVDGDMEPDEPTNKDDSKLTTAKDEPASPENDKQVFAISDSFLYSNFAFPTLLFNFK